MSDTAWIESSTATARCRMVNARQERCTGQVLDPDEKAVQICARHAAEVMELISERTAAVRKTGRKH